MRLLPRRQPVLGVVVPAYHVEAWLPECLDSLLAQDWTALDVVVVDDGSPDASGEIARRYAARDARIRVVRTENQGLGAARNHGLAQLDTEFVAFLDSDDVLPASAYRLMMRSLTRSGSDFVAGSVLRWEDGSLEVPRWMRRLHREERTGLVADDHPEVLGDVFAWNKVFRRSFLERSVGPWPTGPGPWPVGVRYEDQPALTAAYLRGRFDVLTEPVYHWRIRTDGSSITQQRSSLADLRDRRVTKQWSWDLVAAEGTLAVQETFHDRVLAGDLQRYFREIPGSDDAWWAELHAMVTDLWGERSLVQSGLPPVQRLVGWLVEQGRREEAATVVTYAAELGRRLDRVEDGIGRRIDVPVLDVATIAPAALLLRPDEA